jgi:hypothetical protein
VVERVRLEVELGVGGAGIAIGAQDALEVPDSHVVGDEREVLAAAQLGARELEVARRPL